MRRINVLKDELKNIIKIACLIFQRYLGLKVNLQNFVTKRLVSNMGEISSENVSFSLSLTTNDFKTQT